VEVAETKTTTSPQILRKVSGQLYSFTLY